MRPYMETEQSLGLHARRSVCRARRIPRRDVQDPRGIDIGIRIVRITRRSRRTGSTVGLLLVVAAALESRVVSPHFGVGQGVARPGIRKFVAPHQRARSDIRRKALRSHRTRRKAGSRRNRLHSQVRRNQDRRFIDLRCRRRCRTVERVVDRGSAGRVRQAHDLRTILRRCRSHGRRRRRGRRIPPPPPPLLPVPPPPPHPQIKALAKTKAANISDLIRT